MGDPIGERLDALGLVATIEDGEYIESAVVLMKVVDVESGEAHLRSAWTPGQPWLERLGMLTLAQSVDLDEREKR